MDGDYEAYTSRIDGAIAAPLTDLRAAASGRYARRGDAFEPVPMAGCTILALPYPLHLAGVADVQREIARHRAFAPVPEETLHVTLADLALSQDEELLNRAAAVVARHPSPRGGEMAVAGLGMFAGGVVIAVVRLDRPAYEWAVALRRDLDDELTGRVARPRYAFISHVTVGYVEDAAAHGAIAARVVAQRSALPPSRALIAGAAVFTFSDMSHYARV